MTAGGPTLAVSAIVENDGDLLLVRRARDPHRGLLSVPGGRVRAGETLSEAVTRELREETGLEAVCGPFLGLTERLPERPDQQHFVILGFRAHLFERGEPVAGDDADDARWTPLPLVGELPLVPGLAGFLHEHGIIDTIA